MSMADPSCASSSSNPPIPSAYSPPPSTLTLNSNGLDPQPDTPSAPSMTLDGSTTTSGREPQPVVGSGDTQYSRKQLRLSNAFHDIGLDLGLDHPNVVVIGSQSSGKSSLIQAISGVPLPKAPGVACTRCPIECRLMRGDAPEWCCRVFLRRVSNSGGQSTSAQSKELFGEAVEDVELLEEVVLRAQLAILNPSEPFETFLDEDADLTAPTELSFSPDIVCLEITGPDCTDISFVDLPGLIRNVGTGGNPEDIQLIENLATNYIAKENCIILVTITCETDFANQGAYEIARRYDPLGHRTIGVLTKPDRSPPSSFNKWVRYIEGVDEQLRYGWFCVKQPDTQSGYPPPRTLAEARRYEDQYFNGEPPWIDLPRQSRSRLGTNNLVQNLDVTLSDLISRRVPAFSMQIRDLVESTTHRLQQLGKSPSEDCIREINSLVEQLAGDIKDGTQRVSRDEGNLLCRIEYGATEFKRELRETCPEFRAWNSDTPTPESYTPLPDLLLKEGEKPTPAGKRDIIFLDEVVKKKTRATARGLPDGGQNEIAEEYLRSFTEKWDEPTNKFVDKAASLLRSFIHEAINTRCGHFSNADMIELMQGTVDAHLGECLSRTREATKLLLKLLLKLERSGHTCNERYYRECKDTYLTQLKLQRDLVSKHSVLENLHWVASGSQSDEQKVPPTFSSAVDLARSQLSKVGFPPINELDLTKLIRPPLTDSALEDMARISTGSQSDEQKVPPTFSSAIDQARSQLSKVGFPSINELDLAKLIRPPLTDSALEDMARVSAGFEVSLRRFVDYVPLVVDMELVRSICQDLTATLRRSFNLSEPGSVERCRDLLREAPEVQREREHLRQRLHRLNRAEKELMSSGILLTPSPSH